jgi:hypothetical protein
MPPPLRLEATSPEFVVPVPPPAPMGTTSARLPPVEDLPALPLPCPVPAAPRGP